MKEQSIFCVFKNIFRDNNKPEHCVSHWKLRFLDINEFFKITPRVVGEKAVLTGNKHL